MTVRFLTVWNGHQPGSTATLDAGVEAALIAGCLARDNAENDNAGATDLQQQINALDDTLTAQSETLGALVEVAGALTDVVSSYADDAAAATGGVAIGGFYNTAGVVKVRLA